MEREIGEVFEFNDKWYQCINGNGCAGCSFYQTTNCDNIRHILGACSSNSRSDKESAIFKELKKIGEPFYRMYCYEGNNKLCQRYKLYTQPSIIDIIPDLFYNQVDDFFEIEIKQNKEDMEENKLNLKPFDIEAAKAGKPVCTRDGRKARIICFDRNSNKPIVALITTDNREYLTEYYCNGKISHNSSENNDLMMLPEKKEGWVVILKEAIFDTEAEAKLAADESGRDIVKIQKVEWEE